MKILLVKYYKIAISETFILNQADYLKNESVLYHRPFPILFKQKDTFFLKGLDALIKLSGRVSDALYEFLVYSRIRREKPDLVLIQYGLTAAKMYRACQKLGIPYVIHFHGSDAFRNSIITRYSETYRRMFIYAKTIIAVSYDMKRQLVKLGADPDKVIVNPYGINTELFHPKMSSDYLLSVGRLVPKKAPLITIRAFARAYKKHPDIRLIIVGDGPLKSKCMELLKNLEIEHAVTMVGAKSHLEVAQYMSKATLFLQHSVTAEDGDKEGSPVSITEAAACGIPVVSTRHAGIPDIVLDGKTGLLVDEFDEIGMSEAIVQLIEDNELYRAFSMQARKHILENYNINVRLNVLRNVLLSVAETKE